MKPSPLKRLRLNCYMTQKDVAEKMRMSQPNYQRWESGAAPVPESHIKRLAKVLRTTPEAILGKPEPFFRVGETDAERTFFGDIAVHFASAAHPLLLPVTNWEHRFFLHQISAGRTILTVKTLDNRALLMRRTAVTDLYVSEEVEDDLWAPEEPPYHGYLNPSDGALALLPPHLFWRIVEVIDNLEYLDEEEKDFDEQDTKIVRDFLGSLSREDREAYVARANEIEWQLPSGQIRTQSIHTDRQVEEFRYRPWWGDSTLEIPDEARFFEIRYDQYVRSIFINVETVEWLAIPRHRLQRVSLALAEEMVGD